MWYLNFWNKFNWSINNLKLSLGLFFWYGSKFCFCLGFEKGRAIRSHPMGAPNSPPNQMCLLLSAIYKGWLQKAWCTTWISCLIGAPNSITEQKLSVIKRLILRVDIGIFILHKNNKNMNITTNPLYLTAEYWKHFHKYLLHFVL